MPSRSRTFAVPILALVASVASMVVQGFAYGVSNNVFHIPLVLHDFALPQFAGDAFQQTLPRFASPVFPALSLVATRDSLVAWFFGLHVAGRFLTVWSMLRLVQLCGAAGVRLLWAAAVLVAMPGLYDRTAVAQQDLWPDYFTHTALAQAALLWALVRLMEGRFVAACVLSAVAFDVNAFVGVWMAGPLGAALLLHRPRPALRSVLAGLGAGLALSVPVALWIVRTAPLERPDFDYPAFLRSYFPFHFFIDASPVRAVLQLVATVLAGGLAFGMLRLRGALLAGAGLLAVFGAGIVVGAAASSPWLLNLHLLRVDGPLVLLATCGAVALAVRAAGQDAFATGCAVVAVAGCLSATPAVTLLGLLALRLPGRLPGRVRDRMEALIGPAWAWRLRHRAATAAVGAGLVAFNAAALAAYKHWPAPPGAVTERYYIGRWPVLPFWHDAKLWARTNTAPDAVFLIPPRVEGFEMDALRQSWVEWKTGAAAMWAPPFHRVWAGRMDEVASLHTPEAHIRYACAHGIDYVVIDTRGAKEAAGTVAGIAPAFRNPAFAIYPTRSCPSGP